MGPEQVVTLSVTVDLGVIVILRVRLGLRVIAMKGYYIFPRSPGLEPHYEMVQCHIKTFVGGESYLSAEIQSVYFTILVDRDVRQIYLT